MGLFSKEAQTDVEAIPSEKPSLTREVDSVNSITDDGAIPAETFVLGDSWYAKTQRLAGKFGVEQRGIERVPNDERSDAGMSQIGTLWMSANMVVSAFAIGALAYPVFYLGFIDTILIIFFINVLGILPVCFFSTFGPRFGLRQMVLSRFFFGWYGVKIIAIFNVLACVGWSSVNVIVGAQLFHAVNGNMPGWAGIIVIAAATFLVTLFGYKIVHTYERYSWIPCTIIFLIVLGEFAHSGQFENLPMGVGKSEAGACLSFAASVFGFATGWTSYAADYTVYQPVNRSRKSVFLWTFGGLAIPLLFTEMLGAAVATAMATNDQSNAYHAGYESSGIGGLLAVVLQPLGRFGQFCLVILALSIIANNCPNIYSVSLSLQLLARKSQHVPRFIWTFIGTIVYCAIAIPGYSHFESVLENFMLVIAYWLAIYEGISLSEHIFFKRGFSGYHPEQYMSKELLPPGIAAVVAFAIGVMGAVLGMAQQWFTGPIGKLCGTEYGGDIGFELAFTFSAISYCTPSQDINRGPADPTLARRANWLRAKEFGAFWNLAYVSPFLLHLAAASLYRLAKLSLAFLYAKPQTYCLGLFNFTEPPFGPIDRTSTAATRPLRKGEMASEPDGRPASADSIVTGFRSSLYNRIPLNFLLLLSSTTIFHKQDFDLELELKDLDEARRRALIDLHQPSKVYANLIMLFSQLSLFLTGSLFSSTVVAHSWVEEVVVINSDGTFNGPPGYARQATQRSSPNVDTAMVYELPKNPGYAGDPICMTTQQTKSTTDAVQACAGDHLLLRHAENGHVTNPNQLVSGTGAHINKPLGSGIIYIYGTSDSQPTDTYNGIHGQWNSDGTGGDKRGKLLATQYYDDGYCYQLNANFPISVQRQAQFKHTPDELGADLLCQSVVQVPSDATGIYSLYWVWDWPTLEPTGSDVFLNQTYTTCMDVAVGTNGTAVGAIAVSDTWVDGHVIGDQVTKPYLAGTSPTFAQYTANVYPGRSGGGGGTGTGYMAATTASASTSASGSYGGGSTSTPTTAVVVPTTTPASSASCLNQRTTMETVTVTETQAPSLEVVTVTKMI